MDEFLLGVKTDKESSQGHMIEGIINSAKERGNKLVFSVIYLSSILIWDTKISVLLWDIFKGKYDNWLNHEDLKNEC